MDILWVNGIASIDGGDRLNTQSIDDLISHISTIPKHNGIVRMVYGGRHVRHEVAEDMPYVKKYSDAVHILSHKFDGMVMPVKIGIDSGYIVDAFDNDFAESLKDRLKSIGLSLEYLASDSIFFSVYTPGKTSCVCPVIPMGYKAGGLVLCFKQGELTHIRHMSGYRSVDDMNNDIERSYSGGNRIIGDTTWDNIPLIDTINVSDVIDKSKKYNVIPDAWRKTGQRNLLRRSVIVVSIMVTLLLLSVYLFIHSEARTRVGDVLHHIDKQYTNYHNLIDVKRDIFHERQRIYKNIQEESAKHNKMLPGQPYILSPMYDILTAIPHKKIRVIGFSAHRKNRFSNADFSISGIVYADQHDAEILLSNYQKDVSRFADIHTGWRQGWVSNVASWNNRDMKGGINFTINGVIHAR